MYMDQRNRDRIKIIIKKFIKILCIISKFTFREQVKNPEAKKQL